MVKSLMEQVSGGTSNFSEEQKIFYTQGKEIVVKKISYTLKLLAKLSF